MRDWSAVCSGVLLAAAGAREVLITPTNGQGENPCEDGGPWPCEEDGCPSALLGCNDLQTLCSTPFGELWSSPPSELIGKRVEDECRATCAKCKPAFTVQNFAIQLPALDAAVLQLWRKQMPGDEVAEGMAIEYNQKGKAAYARGEHLEAVVALTIASQQQPHRREPWSNLGIALNAFAAQSRLSE